MGIKKKLKSALRSIIDMTKEEKLYPIPQPVNVQQLLEGNIALITGGSGGIGLAMAKTFMDSGCKVILAGTSELKLKACSEKS